MPKHIKTISDGSIIEYDKGSFDDWCVYLTRKGQSRYAPRDVEYFTILKNLGEIYGCQKIYEDFVKLYGVTTKKISQNILRGITRLASAYGRHAKEMDTWFTVIYAGMVAEENKENAVLKKRIKRLGMYQVLVEGRPPEYAATFSKGKQWRELDKVMKPLGF